MTTLWTPGPDPVNRKTYVLADSHNRITAHRTMEHSSGPVHLIRLDDGGAPVGPALTIDGTMTFTFEREG